jgi:hypothetical protein
MPSTELLFSAPSGNHDVFAIASAREVWGPHRVAMGGAEAGPERR